jgi:hypothetical protein
MNKVFQIILSVLLSTGLINASTGELRGVVKDSLNQMPLEMVSVIIQSGVSTYKSDTDENGEYTIKRIPPGTYDVIFYRTGFHKQTVHNVKINNEKISYLDMVLAPTTLDVVEIKAKYYQAKPIGPHTPGTMVTIEAPQIMTSAIERGVMNVITTFVPRTVQTREGGPINFSGSRGNASLFIIDGVKVIGEAFVPQNGIQEVSVITGGIPAEFGDTTSGVVYITTKSYN